MNWTSQKLTKKNAARKCNPIHTYYALHSFLTTVVDEVTKVEVSFDTGPAEALSMAYPDGKFRSLRLNPARESSTVKITLTESAEPNQGNIGLSGIELFGKRLEGTYYS